MNLALENAQNLIKNEGTVPMCSIFVKNSNKLLNRDEIVVASDLGIHFLKSSGKEILSNFKWIEITDLRSSGNAMTLTSKEKTFSFISSEVSKIVPIIELKLQQLLLPEQLKKININYKSKATPATSLFRCKCISQSLYLKMLYNYTHGLNEIVTTIDELPTILSVLPLQPFFKSLTLKLHGEHVHTIALRNYLSKDTILEHLHFDGLLPSSTFFEIVSALEGNMQSKIKAISFSNSGFSQNTIVKLIPLINSKTIRSLSFHNAFESGTHIFYNDLLPKIRKKPRFLNLSDTKGLLIPPLLSSRTVCLSLDRCGIDISDILNSISKSSQNLISLHHLSISGLTLGKPISHIELPQYLHTIYADNVTFNNTSISSFINALISCCNRGFVLSLRDARATQEGWNSVEALFASTNYNKLLGLAWSGNPIPPSLFRFLSRQTQLSRLDASCCLSRRRPKEAASFLSYLEKAAVSLTSLTLRGLRPERREKEKDKPLSVLLLEAVAKAGGVPILDVSDSGGGDGFYEVVGKLSVGGRTRRVLFDGAKPSSKAIASLGALKRSAFLPPPLSDIAAAARSEGEAERLRALFAADVPADAGFAADSFGCGLAPAEYMAGDAVQRVMAEAFAREEPRKPSSVKAHKHRRAKTLEGVEVTFRKRKKKQKALTMAGDEPRDAGKRRKHTEKREKEDRKDIGIANGARPVIRSPLPLPVALGPQTRFIPIVVKAEDVDALLRLSPEAPRRRAAETAEGEVEPLRRPRKARRASSARSTPRPTVPSSDGLSELPPERTKRRAKGKRSSPATMQPASEPKPKKKQHRNKSELNDLGDDVFKLPKSQRRASSASKAKRKHRLNTTKEETVQKTKPDESQTKEKGIRKKKSRKSDNFPVMPHFEEPQAETDWTKVDKEFDIRALCEALD